MSGLKNLLELLKTGSIERKKRSASEKVFFIGKMLLILLILNAISICLLFVLKWTGVRIPANLNREKFESLTKIEILFLTSLYAPILEELTFRLPLKFSKLNLTIGAFGFVLILCRIIAELDYVLSFVIAISSSFVLFAMINARIIVKLGEFWSKNKVGIFYITLLIFSLLHLKNYNITIELIAISPIVILPKILKGIFYSYVRLNYGIILAVCFHFLNNGFLSIIKLIMA